MRRTRARQAFYALSRCSANPVSDNRSRLTGVERVSADLAEDRAALTEVIAETSPSSDAAMVVRLSIRQFETELAWLDEVEARQRPG